MSLEMTLKAFKELIVAGVEPATAFRLAAQGLQKRLQKNPTLPASKQKMILDSWVAKYTPAVQALSKVGFVHRAARFNQIVAEAVEPKPRMVSKPHQLKRDK
ncbi:MAG: hypothetical protein V1847_03005 [Candidatus Diapherotrites archaeon]